MDLEKRVAELEHREAELRMVLPSVIMCIMRANVSAAGTAVALAGKDFDEVNRRLDDITERHREAFEMLEGIFRDD